MSFIGSAAESLQARCAVACGSSALLPPVVYSGFARRPLLSSCIFKRAAAYRIPQRQHAAQRCNCSVADPKEAEAKAKVPTSNLDVSNSVVETSFRTGTEAAESEEQASTSTTAQVLFVSESNVCRSVLAEAILKQQLKDCGLDSIVNVQSKGTREYNIGEGADVSVQAVAQQMGLELDPNFKARQVNPERDIVHFDVVLVMDKYTAADLLREISIYDTIDKDANYSSKVRRLGEYHPNLAATKDQEGQDIGDPLYGNEGGVDELAAVEDTAEVIRESCQGFVQFLQKLREQHPDASSFKQLVHDQVTQMQDIEWLKPPMLARSRA